MTRLPSDRRHPVYFRLNGRPVHGEAEPRLLATDFLKRLLHVRIEARPVAEVGIENVFHAVSCLRSADCFKAGRQACKRSVVSTDYRGAATRNYLVGVSTTAVVAGATTQSFRPSCAAS